MLRTRLVLGLVSLLLLLAVVGYYAVWTTRQLGHQVTARVINHARGMVAAQELKEQAEHMGALLRQMRLSDYVDAQKEFGDVQSRFMSALREQSGASSADRQRTALLADIATAFDRLVARTDSRQVAELPPLELMKIDETALYAVLHAIGRLTDYDTAALQRAEINARVVTARTTTVFAIGVGAAVLLAVFFAWTTSNALLGPIKQLTASAVAMGEGDLDRDVPVASRDELGELAHTFNAMAARLRTYRDALMEKAQRAQRTMEATLTSAPDPLFVVDAGGAHTVRNPAAEELASSAEFAQGFPEALDRPLAVVLESGEHYLPTDYTHLVTVRDRYYLPRILAVGDKLTNFRGAAVILQDVTKFRLLDDAKTNLVGTVSHELKTPLTSLRLSVYLLLEPGLGELTATQHELLETARDESDRLLRILNDLLDLTRLETGVAAPDLTAVPIDDLMQEMAREIKPITDAAGQAVVIELADKLPAAIAVDRESIRHVFTNLLTNASKYSPEGGRIELYGEGADDFVRFGVRDRGCGINDENLPRLFEKFYRVPGQSKKGAGLGLAIAREIVVAHGGTIACANRPEGGCDFHFFLPIRTLPA
jgi:signal transduction histidine kinase